VSETDISRQIQAIADKWPGCVLVRCQAGGYRQRTRGAGKGAPDRIGCYHGTPLGVEVKTDTGSLSADQLAWAERWRASGGVYIMVRSSAEFAAWLAKGSWRANGA
jgi:hypothetical protein